MLLRGGLEVQESASGDDALDAAVERPAAVVLEVVLPDADGFEVCRELRDRHGESLPVIMVSGERSRRTTASPACSSERTAPW